MESALTTTDPLVHLGAAGRSAFAVLRHHDGAQDWLVGFRLAAVGDRPGEWRAVEFAVRQVDETAPSAMTSKTIRVLPIGELLAAARKALSVQIGARPVASRVRFVSSAEDRLAAFLEDGRGRQPRDDQAYAGLAVEYSFLVQDGDRTPAKTLAGMHGGVSGTWANRIAEARKRGMLTAVKPGEAGGGLTDKALKTLHPGWSPEDDALIDAELAERE
ncbi:hypothetical protein [Actinoplanes sp. TFC3]|uniref:hypothetical protein n=1 Tax=Actinoplanes sp. TFC3 TaxID=1710355 RepID=UPI0008343986|nr:hypothetical protein [Actinoplanes sp. TFC3]